jgi:hypothetical protein
MSGGMGLPVQKKLYVIKKKGASLRMLMYSKRKKGTFN